jgi:hypothetical protein
MNMYILQLRTGGSGMKVRTLAFFFLLIALIIEPSLGSLTSGSIISSSGTIQYYHTSWLHVEGRYIKNELGDIVFLRGAAFGDLSWQNKWQGGSVLPRFQEYIKYGANVVRCAIGGRTLYDPSVVASSVQELFDLCVANNIYVVLDFHGGLSAEECASLGADSTPYLEWWRYWVSKYYNVPNVLYELYNEPWTEEIGGAEVYYSMIRQAISLIQSYNPRALIIVASANWNTIDADYWVNNPVNGNIVYSWDHYYKDFGLELKNAYKTGDYETGYQLMDQQIYSDAMYASVEYNLPVVCTEFGFLPEHFPNNVIIPQAVEDYISVMNKYETGWLMWMWWQNPSNYGMCDGSWSKLYITGEIWARYLVSFS